MAGSAPRECPSAWRPHTRSAIDRGLSGLISLLVGAILALAPAETEAATPALVDLDWQGPAECPDTAQVQTTIARLVGGSTSRDLPRTQVRARVRPQEGGFVVDLWARTGRAEDHRTIGAARCSALADATALIVAVALRPMEVTRSLTARAPPGRSEGLLSLEPTVTEAPPLQRPDALPASASSDDPDSDPNPDSDPDPNPKPNPDPMESTPTSRPSKSDSAPSPTTDEPEPRRARALRLGLAGTIGPGFGVLPSVAAELRGSASLLGHRWRVEASAMHWFRRNTVEDSADLPGAEVDLTGGGVRGCYVVRRNPLGIPLCTGLEVGSMRGRGYGPGILPRASRSLWMAVPVGLGLTWSPSPLVAFRLGADVIIPLVRPAFDIRTESALFTVFRAPAIGGRASLGIEIRLP